MRLPELPLFERAAARISTRSALNPLLWLCAISSPLCFLLATTSGADIAIWFLAIGTLPIAASLGAYLYFMLRNPNRLQSEEYQLDRFRLEHLGDSDSGEAGPKLTIDLDRIERPEPREDNRGADRP